MGGRLVGGGAARLLSSVLFCAAAVAGMPRGGRAEPPAVAVSDSLPSTVREVPDSLAAAPDAQATAPAAPDSEPQSPPAPSPQRPPAPSPQTAPPAAPALAPPAHQRFWSEWLGRPAVEKRDRPWRRQKNARLAMTCSFLVPGLGQMYNEREFWALVAAGFEFYFIGDIVVQQREMNRWSAYTRKFPDDLEAQVLVILHRDNRIQSTWLLAFSALLSGLQSFVDAHLFDFDESPPPPVQVTLGVVPVRGWSGGLGSGGWGAGVAGYGGAGPVAGGELVAAVAWRF